MKKSYMHLFLAVSLALPVGLSTAIAQQADADQAEELEDPSEFEEAHTPFYAAYNTKVMGGVVAVALVALGGAVWKGIGWKKGELSSKPCACHLDHQSWLRGDVIAPLTGNQIELFAFSYELMHREALQYIAEQSVEEQQRHYYNVNVILDGLLQHDRAGCAIDHLMGKALLPHLKQQLQNVPWFQAQKLKEGKEHKG